MKNLMTRKLIFGVLMACVLALGMVGIVDALTLRKASGDLQTKSVDSSFEITFSVGLRSDTRAYDNARKLIGSVNTSPPRIDSQGYRVFDVPNGREYRLSTAANALTGTFVGPTAAYGVDSGGTALPDSQLPAATSGTLYVDTGRNVVDDQGRPVYTRTGTGARDPADPWRYTRAKANPDDPLAKSARFDYNEEQITVDFATGSPETMSFALKSNGLAVTDVLSEKPDTDYNPRPLTSSVTLICRPTAVGTYMITIADSTPADDFPASSVPADADRATITFTLYVVGSPQGDADTVSISADYRDFVLPGNADQRIDEHFTFGGTASTDTNIQLLYQVLQGPGTVYVRTRDDNALPAQKSILTSRSAKVYLNMNGGTNKVTVSIVGQDPETQGATTVYRVTGTSLPISGDPTPRDPTPQPTTRSITVSSASTSACNRGNRSRSQPQLSDAASNILVDFRASGGVFTPTSALTTNGGCAKHLDRSERCIFCDDQRRGSRLYYRNLYHQRLGRSAARRGRGRGRSIRGCVHRD